ncbi:hypothetical protein OrNV_gp008 [Oryctes rhinoceros nudivirus]|uniref:Uncharacterized protein n=1 Tax=Oryctes rhinoceros nudivirus TaxID=92521 RepID=A0A6B9QSA7_9VIRU|nr:hypothetical protein OrNV_gp008 [Oryctes rhinoceros nudivirus]ACH96138.1 unknown [Oryctes rhinoceros nudivirus]QHG11247.1 hypothetical protein SI_OrNV_gp008 [Oryctes rhinoceros nudivirus]QKE59482.1 hypothetical protein SI_OrNV_gp008 [Oryctes rhinoceros nudivirus]UBO76429.1 hypothetical protein SI_OrNV_gp008 [Oryctes rhinoceros nudivirus]UBR58190.1 hypothetical protein [Oryctes rhinoceros nudivirus]
MMYAYKFDEYDNACMLTNIATPQRTSNAVLAFECACTILYLTLSRKNKINSHPEI